MRKRFDIHIPPITGALIMVIAPHFSRLPFWIAVWCIILWIYALTASKKGWYQPRRFVLTIFSLGSFLAFLITFRRSLGSDAYVGLLSIMAALKLFEISSHRDRMILIFLAYFIIIANLFYSEANSLVMIIYMTISVLVITAVLIHINHPAGRLKTKFHLAGILMLQAVPLMLILFFLFPRIQGSLWGIVQKGRAASGFSDHMSPGSISGIVQNNAIAFRAQFEDKIPQASQRYWRGIVFHVFDGRTWKRGRGFRIPQKNIDIKGSQSISYTITLEPHKDRWLFALELPNTVPNTGFALNDYTIFAKRPVNRRILYKLNSYLNYKAGKFEDFFKKITLKLPSKGNPKAKALARQWMETSTSPEAVVEKAMQFFREKKFTYTLNPPLLKANPVDDFLFNTRQGYCEHYASAFTFLMRAAKIPARVVGGYLGGEVNPYANYLIIRQSDAHAWSEVWLPNKGWTRVDPTSAVAPERIEQGLRQALSAEDISQLVEMPNMGIFTSFIHSALFAWDMVNAYWNLWFVSYSFEEQQSLLAKLGIEPHLWKAPLKAMLLAIGLITFFTFLFIICLYYKSNIKQDPVKKFYDKFCYKLGKIGIPRKPDQGPVDYAEKIISIREDLKPEVLEIIDLYTMLRYGRGGDKNQHNKLKKLVKQFNPKN